MRIHHLNCGTFCPLLGDVAVTHCLLLETDRRGLVLVDTGFGDHACREQGSLHWSTRWSLRPRLQPGNSALQHVQRLGFRREDVRHILITHLDVDHAGGIPDFPEARVHLHHAEYAARASARYSFRFWSVAPKWASHEPTGERWYGFAAARPIAELDSELALIPLAGHTRGHSGVAVRTGSGWLLHAGDAYLLRDELEERKLRWQPALAARLTSELPGLRSHNVRRLAALARERAAEVSVVSSHSQHEYQACVSTFEPAAATKVL